MAAVWAEYGDLIYLIWTFQPIEDSALGDIDSYTARWFEDHEFPGHEKDAPEAQKAVSWNQTYEYQDIE